MPDTTLPTALRLRFRSRRRDEVDRSRVRRGGRGPWSPRNAIMEMAMRYGSSQLCYGFADEPGREAEAEYHRRAARRRFGALQRLVEYV